MSTTESRVTSAAASPCPPPRDNLVRALRPGLELRTADNGDAPTLFGHFAIFNRWAEIDSWFEGHFMERIAPGAFKKTIDENRDAIKVTFNHGMDPTLGDKPLGPIDVLEEDRKGGYYEVPLLDTDYNRELIPGLEAGLYGASFRFQVIREEFNEEPDPSDTNPKGIPERTLKELRLFEFGPVTFPAYVEADAGLRSLTDRFTFDAIERHPERFRELLSVDRAAITAAATDEEAPAPEGAGANEGDDAPERVTPSGSARRPAPAHIVKFESREEWLKWIEEN
jgi:HK97 family phage prohead protease